MNDKLLKQLHCIKTENIILKEKVLRLQGLCEHHKSQYEQVQVQLKLDYNQKEEQYITTINKFQQQIEYETQQLNMMRDKFENSEKQYTEIIDNLTRLNKQYKKSNDRLLSENDEEIKEITTLSTVNNQLEIALESTAMTLEQKAAQINRLQQEIEILRSDGIHELNNKDSMPPIHFNTMLLNHTDSKQSHLNMPSNIHQRRSYIFAMRTPMTTMSSVSVAGSSIISVGGDSNRGSNMFYALDTIKEQSDYQQLYVDEKNGVDAYVYIGDEQISNDSNNKDHQVKESFFMIKNDTLSAEYEEKYKLQLKEMKIKYDLEIMKLKNELESIKEGIMDTYKNEDISNDNETKQSSNIKHNSERVPKEFNDYKQTQCAIFGWNLW